jgi:hypothetical protein
VVVNACPAVNFNSLGTFRSRDDRGCSQAVGCHVKLGQADDAAGAPRLGFHGYLALDERV